MLEVAAVCTMLVLWTILAGQAGLRSLKRVVEANSSTKQRVPIRSEWLSFPFVRLLHRMNVFDYFQLAIASFHMKLVILNGHTWTIEQTKSEAGAALGTGYGVLTACAALAALAQERLLLVLGGVVGMVVFLRPFVEAGRRVHDRKQQMVMELPHMLSRLMLLVGAGETVQQAAARCLDGDRQLVHPLYKEWSGALALMANGQSFSAAMERFNRRCTVQEVSVFTTVLLLNYRRGGEQFVLALRELSYALWEKRKAMARIRGEQASAKLVFPLVGILLVMMVLVAAPAVLLMG